MGVEQTVFSREEEFFREEYEDGVVLQGTVQSVKEKDGTLEVVLKNCETEDADGETLRSVLCYLNEDSEFPAVGEKIRVFGEGKAADPARNPGVFDHQLYCRAKGISGIIYADGYTGMGGKLLFPAGGQTFHVHAFSRDIFYPVSRRCVIDGKKMKVRTMLPPDAD